MKWIILAFIILVVIVAILIFCCLRVSKKAEEHALRIEKEKDNNTEL